MPNPDDKRCPNEKCQSKEKYKCKKGHWHYEKCQCPKEESSTSTTAPQMVSSHNEETSVIIPTIRCRSFLKKGSMGCLNPKTSLSPISKIDPNSKGAIEVKAGTTTPLTFSALRGVYQYTVYPVPTNRRATVAIVDAYLYRTSNGAPSMATSTAPSDMKSFCALNKLTPPTFLPPVSLSGTIKPIVFPNPNMPYFVEAAAPTCGLDPSDNEANPGWPLEQALDVQTVYGMTNTTPNPVGSGPNIILVHALNDSFAALSTAITQAIALGADVISLSWGAPEFVGETSFDSIFNNVAASKVSFVVSSGDEGYGSYPAFSPYVIAVGGTNITINGSTRVSETAWGNPNNNGNGGGGVSGSGSGGLVGTPYGPIPVQEHTPIYQSSLNYRGRSIPDISFFASAQPGVEIVLSRFVAPRTTATYIAEYWLVGGTSLSAPAIGAAIAIADQMRINVGKPVLTSTQILTALYGAYAKTTVSSYCQGYIYNVTSGTTYMSTEQIVRTRGGTQIVWTYLPDNSAVAVTTSKGYDLATGLGVPSTGLIAYLAGL